MTLPPGGTIGLFGSGQLGRMFAMAAHRLGYGVHVYSPDVNSPAGQAADLEITASYTDTDALEAFARGVDLITLEFENIPLAAIDAVENIVPVRPGRDVLAAAQNRYREKTAIQQAGLPTAEFSRVATSAELLAFMSGENGIRPAVLKSAESGYDGRGQTVVRDESEVSTAFDVIGTSDAIAEELVDFECEVSVVGARSISGEIECFGPVWNSHVDHILDVSVAPAEVVPAEFRTQAVKLTATLLERLEVVGVVCVEFFLTTDGRLLVNEIAPRPHNSGHLTIEAAVTSQFEQQVRAVCGLPLGSMEQVRPAAMANLLGRHLPREDENWAELLKTSGVKLHLYGKQEPRPKRKMGHLTATATEAAAAESAVREARLELLGASSEAGVTAPSD